MAEYKRWIAYLYNYENGFKKNCVGTARIERKGDEAKTTVSIQVPSLVNETLKNIYYIRTVDQISGIRAGEFVTDGSAGNWQISMNANDMGGSGHKLEQMDGFLVCKDSNKYFASAWDERPLLPTEVHHLLLSLEEETQKKSIQKIYPDRIELTDTEETIDPDYLSALPTSSPTSDDSVLKASSQENASLESAIAISVESIQQVTSSEGNDTPSEFAIENETPSEPSSETNDQLIRGKTAPDRIFAQCPIIWPFSEPWADRCVKLELEDIGLLPAKHWQLCANSFLMHSYYGYRHLVLARIREGGKYRYELLVPGIFNEREQELAKLFGFHSFRPASSRPINAGEYGYWSMPVVFGD